MTELHLKRAYEPASPTDGFRVYIDRLWPRGLSHLTFHYDMWDKEIAPSADLRDWFHADPDGRWKEFEHRYASELKANPAWSELVAELQAHLVVTLIYSSHSVSENNAIVLAQTLVKSYHDKFIIENS